MSITTRVRRGLATALAGALATGGLFAMAVAPAEAASKTVAGVSLTWGLSNEQGGGAFFGGCNFLSAGVAGDTGSSRVWTEADGFYKAVDGNVSIEKPTTAGAYVAPTWSTKCLTPAGTAASAASTSSTTGNRVRLSKGTGTIDSATGAGTISWTGSFTSVFYGGLTYWSATNPQLTIAADGTGTLTATASGYGSDMADTSKWVPLTPRTITLANFAGVEVTDDGFSALPTYLGTAVDTGDFTPQPEKTTANTPYWGSFPQSYVDFQKETGQSSYWYTSGGSRDVAKPATTVNVTVPNPKVEVTKTTFLPDGTQSLTVTGTGFDPSLATGTRPPLMNSAAGAYIAVGKFAANWRPSTGAASSSRKAMTSAQGGLKWAVPEASVATVGGAAAGAVVLSPDGSFTATLNVNKAQLDAAAGTDASLVNYGIYTYPGSGAVAAAYETYTPITFAQESSTITAGTLESPIKVGTGSSTEVTVAGGAITPTGTVVALDGDTEIGEPATLVDGVADVDLGDLPVGDRSITFTYSGDANYLTSTSTAQTVSVVKALSTTSATAFASPVALGTTASSEVTVASEDGTPTGVVTALDGEETLDEQTLDEGTATFDLTDLAVGTHSITFSYEGDDTFGTSTSSAQTVTVTKAAATPSVSGVGTSAYGSARTATVVVPGTAGVDAPTGTVTASVNGAVVGSGVVTNGTTSIALPRTLKAGATSVVYAYSGDANYDASSTTQAFTVTKASVSVKRGSIKKPTTKKTGKTSLSLTSTATVTGKVTVTFTKKGQKTKTKTVTIRSGKGTVTIPKLKKGTWKISVKYTGTANFAASATKSLGSFKVTK